jgi:hypothetical protein
MGALKKIALLISLTLATMPLAAGVHAQTLKAVKDRGVLNCGDVQPNNHAKVWRKTIRSAKINKNLSPALGTRAPITSLSRIFFSTASALLRPPTNPLTEVRPQASRPRSREPAPACAYLSFHSRSLDFVSPLRELCHCYVGKA